MFIVEDYSLAVLFCFITMLCWGSWANTQKLVSKQWRYEYFYWDYVIGLILCAFLFAFTLGSYGSVGRSFLQDIEQASWKSMGLAFIGGIVFNIANVLLSAAIAVCGMAVAFPLGIGLALVLGVLLNFLGSAKGSPELIAVGVLLILIAILANSRAYKLMAKGKTNKASDRGIVLAIIAGVIMSLFYRFVAASMDLDNFKTPQTGLMTPYTALVVFALGVFASTFIISPIMRRYPVDGEPIDMAGYFKGSFSTHLIGIMGGVIWCTGQGFSLIASGKAGAAISYGLGQGATLVSALWGILIWKEFKNAPPSSRLLNVVMFVLFIAGLILLMYAGK